MRRTWWEIVLSAALLLLVGMSINCELIAGLQERTFVAPDPEGEENAYTCECSLTVFGGDLPDTPTFTVCASDTVGRDPQSGKLNVVDINQDCQKRVATTFGLMAEACPDIAFVEAKCFAAATPARFEQACPREGQIVECAKEEVLPDCSNFIPEQPEASKATLPPGGLSRGDEPVCFVASSATASSDFTAALELPTAVPTPMAAGIFGQHSTCVLNPAQSKATVTLDSEVREPAVSGVVEFLGAPCPGASCAVGMTYQLDLAPFSFATFCAGTEIRDVRTVGTVAAGALTLDANGEAQIAAGQTLTSARGTRQDSGCFLNQEVQMSFVGTNGDLVAVAVDWANKTCRVQGALLGATVEQNNTLSVEVDLAGTLVNQPPTAHAGADQTVECTSAAGAAITLDGSASSDPDDNLAGARWLQGGRTGPVVGTALQVTLPQGLGAPGQYLLRVIDAVAQSAADTTTVQVVDTTAPTLTDVQATPNALKPPNHKMVPVTVAVSATDSCDAAPVCKLTVVTSNEPENGPGDGNTSPDWELTGPLTVSLRAERAGNGGGRVYTLAVECTDATGNAAQGTTTVSVPH
jgi:hypothetical protein